MEDPGESVPTSLLALRVAAAVGVVVAAVVVVVGFGYGLVFGLLALFFLPAVPMVFVLAVEAVRGSAGDKPGPAS